MDLVGNRVSYCCVSKGGRVLYTYSSGDHEIENMAALCLELTPPYHRWYFETMAKKTFGFLIDDEYVYFAIVDESLGNSRVLKFLHKLKDGFHKLGKKGSSTRSVSSLNSLCLQEQLLPIVHSLIASLEHASADTVAKWPADNEECSPSPSSNNANGNGASTKAPLLGKHGKQEKKKMKDHVINVRGDHEMEEHRRSTDGVNNTTQETVVSSLQKDSNSTRVRSTSQNLQKKWCRQVRIVLAIDAAVCIVLFGIWLVVCRGIECTR